MRPIGPKVQTHIPPQHAAFIKYEARFLGVSEAEALRLIIEAGITAIERQRQTADFIKHSLVRQKRVRALATEDPELSAFDKLALGVR